VTGVTAGLRGLLGRLEAFKVDFVRGAVDYLSDRYQVQGLDEANAISSQIKLYEAKALPGAFESYGLNMHVVVIDVDHPVHVVSSSTPGHHHLYVEIPPTPWEWYLEWLQASAKIGLVEPGYVAASAARGHSAVRLPWITKADDKELPELDEALKPKPVNLDDGPLDPW
jgi:hypothetical protein